MTTGNFELLQVLVSWAVMLPGMAAILMIDEKRLRGAQAERAWPTVSRNAAIFATWNFPLLLLLVLPIHFGRTRRSVAGVLLGFGWVVAVLATDYGAQSALAAAVDVPGL